ncbi:MAG: rhodanese-like domain-containing protein [Acidobacteriota bacterium]
MKLIRSIANRTTFTAAVTVWLTAAGCGLRAGGISIPADMAKTWLTDTGRQVYLLDVRGSGEVAQGTIPGADGIASYWDWPGSFRALGTPPRKDQTIIVYCARGIRSALATRWLRRQGYTEAYNLAGGVHAWTEAGGAIQR